MSWKQALWPWLILLLVLAAPGCGKRCAERPTFPAAPVVKEVRQRCLTQPPPNPPPPLARELDGDAPLTPDALDLFEQWAAALVAYSARAWRECGARD